MDFYIASHRLDNVNKDKALLGVTGAEWHMNRIILECKKEKRNERQRNGHGQRCGL